MNNERSQKEFLIAKSGQTCRFPVYRLSTFLLYLAATLALPFAIFASPVYNSGVWSYRQISGEQAMLVDYDGPGGKVQVPESIDGLTVTRIGTIGSGFGAEPQSIFRRFGKEFVTDIILPNTINQLSPHAFDDCSGLTNVQLPSNLKTIPEKAFFYCRKLTTIKLPEQLVDIQESAFEGTALDAVVIPASVTNIGPAAFRRSSDTGAIGLSTVVFSEGVFALGPLQRRTSPSLKQIGRSAFENCNLKEISLPENLETIGPSAFAFTPLTSLTIPKSVTTIGAGAFAGCTNLVEINIPNSVTNVGEGAFARCERLERVVWPSNLQHIPDRAFAHCRGPWRNMPGLSSFEVPLGVKSIGVEAFMGCLDLTTITIPSSVTRIGKRAFAESGLKSVELPGSVAHLEEGTFERCTELAKVTIQEGVTTIGFAAFSSCTSLATITIPQSVKGIESSAFRNCSSLPTSMIPERFSSQLGRIGF